MRLSNSVFDSASERRVFRALESRWGEVGNLYPQIPLAKLVELEASDKLTAGERNYFFSANVDYTFCDESRPLFSIEFDGIGGGHSRNGVYLPKRETDDPHRELKMGFKLRAARDAGYHMVVVSFEETEPFGDSGALTLLDSIIGQFLARREQSSRVQQLLDEAVETQDLEAMNGEERQCWFDDLLTRAEVEAEYEYDPLARAEAEELGRYLDWNGGRGSLGMQHLADPPMGSTFDAERLGCEATVQTPWGNIIERAWIRNIGYDLDIFPSAIAENMSRYLALRKANRIFDREPTPAT